MGTDDATYVGTDSGLVDRRRIMGVGTPDDESDHAGDWTDSAPAAGDPMQDDLDPEDVLGATGAPPEDAIVQEQDAREELERERRTG